MDPPLRFAASAKSIFARGHVARDTRARAPSHVQLGTHMPGQQAQTRPLATFFRAGVELLCSQQTCVGKVQVSRGSDEGSPGSGTRNHGKWSARGKCQWPIIPAPDQKVHARPRCVRRAEVKRSSCSPPTSRLGPSFTERAPVMGPFASTSASNERAADLDELIRGRACGFRFQVVPHLFHIRPSTGSGRF